MMMLGGLFDEMPRPGVEQMRAIKERSLYGPVPTGFVGWLGGYGPMSNKVAGQGRREQAHPEDVPIEPSPLHL